MFGMQVLLISLLLVTLFVAACGMSPDIGLVFALAVWLPVYLCCSVLRWTNDQGWAVLAVGTIAVVYILLVYWLIADVPAWWQEWIESWIDRNAALYGMSAQRQDTLVKMAPAMNALMASGIVISLAIKMFISRGWQALLFKKGGFRTEFYNLQIPGAVIFLLLVAGIALLYFATGDHHAMVGLEVLCIIIILYSFQGIASVHRIVTEKNMQHYWLIIMYVLLFFMPQMILLLACLGLVDSYCSRANNGNEP